MPIDTQKLLRRCAGKLLRVQGIDEFGALELHVLDDGSQAPGPNHHIIYLEPQYAEPLT
jgi:hypothetical protein